MPDKPDIWAFFVEWIQHQWPALYAAGLSVAIAALRIIYGGGRLRAVLLEAPLCGGITLAASSGLGAFGIPPEAGPFVGGVVGLFGVEWVRAMAKRFLEKKVGVQ